MSASRTGGSILPRSCFHRRDRREVVLPAAVHPRNRAFLEPDRRPWPHAGGRWRDGVLRDRTLLSPGVLRHRPGLRRLVLYGFLVRRGAGRFQGFWENIFPLIGVRADGRLHALMFIPDIRAVLPHYRRRFCVGWRS